MSPLADAATERPLRHIPLDEEAQIQWGGAALAHLYDQGEYDRTVAEAFAAQIREAVDLWDRDKAAC
jgi:hypothetical protein